MPKYCVVVVVFALSTAIAFLSGCSDQTIKEPLPPYDHTLDISELMHRVIEPASDIIWDSAGTIDTIDGREDLAPTSDAEWLDTMNAAAVLVEYGNLLKLPSRSENRSDWIEIASGLSAVGHKLIAAAEDTDRDNPVTIECTAINEQVIGRFKELKSSQIRLH